jgi:hypothetical protein
MLDQDISELDPDATPGQTVREVFLKRWEQHQQWQREQRERRKRAKGGGTANPTVPQQEGQP